MVDSKSVSEQKLLLEKPTNWQVFAEVKDTSSSLIVLGDAASGFSTGTRSTEMSSNWSMVFPSLDAELMGTNVYQKAVRSLFKPKHRQSSRTKGLPGVLKNADLSTKPDQEQSSRERRGFSIRQTI